MFKSVSSSCQSYSLGNNQTGKSKSPYKPKLLQALIDSSDQDNYSINSSQDNHSNQQYQINNRRQQQLTNNNQFKSRFGNMNINNMNDDQKSQKSYHTNKSNITNLTQQTTKSNITTKQSNITNKNNVYKQNNMNKQNKPQTLNLSSLNNKINQSKVSVNQPNMTKSKQQIISFNEQGIFNSLYQQNKFNSLNQKNKSIQSPNITIKYDTLKLSQYNSDQIKNQQRLYQQNLQQFKSKFNNNKNANLRQNIQQSNQQSNYENQFMDSLQAIRQQKNMKTNQQPNQLSRQMSRQLSRKTIYNNQIKKYNESSTPSSRIKFIRQQKQSYHQEQQQNNYEHKNHKQSDIQENNQTISYEQSQTDKLKKQIKRLNNIIKTIGIKNSDLQKTIQMKNIKLQQIQQQQTSRISLFNSKKHKDQIIHSTYNNVVNYMKVRVTQLMDDIKTIKMSPLLQQKLQNFIAQLLQINQITVSKTLNIQQDQQDMQSQQINKDSNIKESNNLSPYKLTKSIFNSKSPQCSKQSQNIPYSTANNFKSKYQTAQSHIIISNNNNKQPINNRSNALINNISRQNIKGVTVKLDLSSNKQNLTPNKNITPNKTITPNKRANADQQFKLLQKSLHKLKQMEKQLHTPVSNKNSVYNTNTQFINNNNKMNQNNQFYTNKSNLTSKDIICKDYDQYKNQYSIINRTHFSGLNKQQNNSINLSSNNLDRSKSRRKKIFADTNQKP